MTRSEKTARDAARARAKIRGVLLILAPDGRCALCKRRRPLEVDHVDGAGWSRRGLSRWSRANRYVRELCSGVRLRALCRPCNAGHNPAKKKRAAVRGVTVVSWLGLTDQAPPGTFHCPICGGRNPCESCAAP